MANLKTDVAKEKRKERAQNAAAKRSGRSPRTISDVPVKSWRNAPDTKFDGIWTRIRKDKRIAVLFAAMAPCIRSSAQNYRKIAALMEMADLRIQLALCQRRDIKKVMSKGEAATVTACPLRCGVQTGLKFSRCPIANMQFRLIRSITLCRLCSRMQGLLP